MKFLKHIWFLFLFVYISETIFVTHNLKLDKNFKTESYANVKKIIKRDILFNRSKSWNVSGIQYYVQPPVNEANVNKAIEFIQNNTCIKFIKMNDIFYKKQGLIFKNDTTCSSSIGLVNSNKPQVITLSRNCYLTVGYILHEIGHALGLIHEQSRRDRDYYVEINFKNIKSDNHKNFHKLVRDIYKNFSTQYDYNALMHYAQKSFAINTKIPVIKSKLHEAHEKVMGNRKKMTFNEIKQINLRHCNKCNWVTNNGLRTKKNTAAKCINGGYPDYNNCKKCICPTGYTGTLCNEIEKSDNGCPDNTYEAKSEEKCIIMLGKKKCYIFLKANRGKKIKLQFISIAKKKRNTCDEETSNEIKYFLDKGSTGLLLCNNHWLLNLTSQSNSVLITYRGQTEDDLFAFSFCETTK
ncbi:Astacin-like metalloendopeptidase [Strongyloides ratti]|uniref:Metalloendopeptidase n=1 Tax=Strongyloides ratti TaxID=34506 RepID=A0A090KQQ9_STRRB|nr:Astacin-like metalloendopeptidase [Strongyloides ratti]CEF59684.1 Astacin-like metalloendopeptidase [Strongyloides ratti]